MGRIKDKLQYPIKGSPDNNDYVVGTDSESGGTTVSFRLGDLFIQTGGEGLLPKDGFDGTAQDIIDLIPTVTSQLTNNGSFGGQPYVEQDSLDLLQAQVAALQSIILGEGVDLALIEELVIAIQNIQTYLDTILVNDLVTGGTTKALTAEQGVVLNGLITDINLEFENKVDKVVGERLINADEIQKLSDLSGVNTGDQDLSSYQTLNEKGQANGYVPLSNLIKVPSEYLTIVNNLTAGGATSILSAEQGRQIKILIDNINSLLASDNQDLDTLQEIVDAIEQLQQYFTQLIVNDLVTGGTTKALSAEQGVVLKGLIESLNTDIQTALSFKENAFLKNTAFNKNFGTTAGTVADGSHVSDTNNPHSVTKQQVGLGNVDNTSDLDKPVSTAVQTELDLKLDKSSIVSPDAITKIGTIDQTGSNITINALEFEWRINQVDYTNTLQYTTTIANATDGYNRIDLIVANTSNSFTKIEGIESIELAVKPDLPNDTLEVSFINVYGSTISQPATAKKGFITESSKSFIRMFYTGDVDKISIGEESWLKFEQGMTSLKSINIPNKNNFYFGKTYIIKNGTSGDITLFHLQGTGGFRFNFPNGQDLLLKPEESISVILRAINSQNNGGLLDYVGIATDINSKVDKVAGERLINALEITKLSNTSGTNTGDQDLSGKVDKVTGERLINALEITKLSNTSGTNTGDQDLSGKQDVLISGGNIKTLNGESILGSGPLTLSVMPAPFLVELVPDTYLPSTTGNFILNGSFFTPTMTVVVEGHTINYKTFISSNKVLINLTTSATEGTYDVTLNNGVSAIFPDRLQVVTGTVYKPQDLGDWTLTEPIEVEGNNVIVQTYNSFGIAIWNKEFDYNKDFSVSFSLAPTPLGTPIINDLGNFEVVLVKAVDNTDVFRFNSYTTSANANSDFATTSISGTGAGTYRTGTTGFWSTEYQTTVFEFKYISGVMYYYVNNVLKGTFSYVLSENLKFKVRTKRFNVTNIKYIDLSDTSGTLQDVRGKTSELQNDGENGTSPFATDADVALKQDVLISGTNIKTLNGDSILGSGDIVVTGGGGGANSVNLRYETTWVSGTQQFTTPTDYLSVSNVIVQGVSLSGSQYSLQGTNQVTILDTLNANDYVVIIYGSTVALTADPAQITITTAVSITTDTLGNAGKAQKEKNVIIDNGVNAINITVNGGIDFMASYLKHGTGAITFVQGAGRTLTQVDATAVLSGVVGSTATISSVGTIDYLRISNAV
jgi:hypothetical protein